MLRSLPALCLAALAAIGLFEILTRPWAPGPMSTHLLWSVWLPSLWLVASAPPLRQSAALVGLVLALATGVILVDELVETRSAFRSLVSLAVLTIIVAIWLELPRPRRPMQPLLAASAGALALAAVPQAPVILVLGSPVVVTILAAWAERGPVVPPAIAYGVLAVVMTVFSLGDIPQRP